MTTEAEAKKAFLDALAEGESTGAAKAEGISPYFILYGGGSFRNLPRTAIGFPIWPGKDNSHAAGKYQFEPRTYEKQAARLGLSDFSPASQDAAAWDLAATVYHNVIGGNLLTDLLIADDLDSIPSVLHSTWTSLSEATFTERYHAALAAIPTPAPSTSPIPFPLSIQPGTTDEVVCLIQQKLGITADAIFGPETLAAVRSFQAAHGLTNEDGAVDYKTWNALMGITA